MKRKILGFIADSLILITSFYFFVWLRFDTVFVGPLLYRTSVYFFGIFIFLSLLTNKDKVLLKNDLKEVLYPIAFSNIIILAFFVFLGRFVYPFTEFRFLSLYAVFLASVLEILGGILVVIFRRIKLRPFYREDEQVRERVTQEFTTPPSIQGEKDLIKEEISADFSNLYNIIVEETNEATFSFIKQFFTPSISDTLIISTTTGFNIINQPFENYKVIINLKRINDIQYINKFFEAVNKKLESGGMYIDWFETYGLRKERILAKYPGGTNYIIYTLDFIFHRVFPKLPVTKKFYFFYTRGYNRVLSKAEIFGRLYSCGFEIIDEQLINRLLYFVVRKVKEPAFDDHPTYGPLIKLKRIGKEGKIIDVYKLRTMHAYSEYLQGYVFQQNKLQQGGKFKDDFRVTALGRIFRKLWLDELPMLINLFRGEVKLIGVRPLSQHYFDLYTKELKEKRIHFKPGLIPPFYADLPSTLEEIMSSEMKYLESYEKNPLMTDLRCFFKASYNILFKNVRSN